MLQFLKHYLEMVIAMLVGMAVLGIPADMVLPDGDTVMILSMAVTMTVPMVAWMRFRGHGVRSCVEMSAAMFVPALAAASLVGTVDFGTLMVLEHVVMFSAMFVLMLVRPHAVATV
jgi:hypothetical protein